MGWFILGLLIGGIFGMLFMAVFQLKKEDDKVGSGEDGEDDRRSRY